MRYNEKTDMVEIYYNGVWNEWKGGALQFDGYLYLLGSFSTKGVIFTNEYIRTSYVGTTSYANIVLNEASIRINATSTQGTNTAGTFVFTSPLNLKKYSKLRVTLENLVQSQSSYSLTFTCGIATSTSATTFEVSISTKTKGAQTLEVDLSNITDESERYIGFSMANGYGAGDGSACYALISKIELVQ